MCGLEQVVKFMNIMCLWVGTYEYVVEQIERKNQFVKKVIKMQNYPERN